MEKEIIDFDYEHRAWLKDYITKVQREIWSFKHNLEVIQEDMIKAKLGDQKVYQEMQFEKAQLDSKIKIYTNLLSKALDKAAKLNIEVKSPKKDGENESIVAK